MIHFKNDIKKIYYKNNEIKKIYKGSQVVYNSNGDLTSKTIIDSTHKLNRYGALLTIWQMKTGNTPNMLYDIDNIPVVVNIKHVGSAYYTDEGYIRLDISNILNANKITTYKVSINIDYYIINTLNNNTWCNVGAVNLNQTGREKIYINYASESNVLSNSLLDVFHYKKTSFGIESEAILWSFKINKIEIIKVD